MKKYNPKDVCDKCGSNQIVDRYAKKDTDKSFVYIEVIHRKCANCGYFWTVEPMDSDK